MRKSFAGRENRSEECKFEVDFVAIILTKVALLDCGAMDSILPKSAFQEIHSANLCLWTKIVTAWTSHFANLWCPLHLLYKSRHCRKCQTRGRQGPRLSCWYYSWIGGWQCYLTRFTQFEYEHKLCKGHLSFIFNFRLEMDSILPDLQRAVQDCGRLNSNLIQKLFPKEIKLFWGLARVSN